MSLHNNNFDAEKQANLDNLARFLSERTTAFRDGKIYYTYKISHTVSSDDNRNGVVRNNAYNLRLTDGSISAIGRPQP